MVTSQQGSSAFWSLPTDLQLGYEIYDKSNEINAVIQAVASGAIRLNVVSNDDRTRIAQSSLVALAKQLQTSPVALFSEIANAAASRSTNDGDHVEKIRISLWNSNEALNALTNESSPLRGLADVTNPVLFSVINASLVHVQEDSRRVLESAEEIAGDVARARASSSLLLTPELLGNFINSNASAQIVTSLANIRNNFTAVAVAVKDATRLVAAHGSIHDLLSRSLSQDTTTRSTALKNFVNNYSRLRNSVLTSVVTLKQAVANDIKSFIARVQELYDDSIVRPIFDEEQLPVIEQFAKIADEQIYNKELFQTSYDLMRDIIVNSYSNVTGSSATGWSDYRETILYVQRTLFVRKYSRCIDELVSDAEFSSNKITSKQAFCLVERSSSIGVLLPSATSWLATIRRNINSQIEMLNSCLNDEVDVASLYETSECIQSVSRPTAKFLI